MIHTPLIMDPVVGVKIMIKIKNTASHLDADLHERVRWQSESQARSQRYRRFISLSKHTSIFLGTRFPHAVPLFFVLGYPKSGTTWVCQLMADYFRLPFPQNSIFPLGCAAVVHSFETPSKKYQRGVYVMRDGRDAMVSAYFHMRGRMLSGASAAFHKKLFEGLNPNDEPRNNMKSFLERIIDRPAGGWTRVANWGAHVGAYWAMEVSHLPSVRYEDLLSDGERTLSKLVYHLTGTEADVDRVRASLQRYSFQTQSGRRQGEENRESSLRKGQAGDWVNHFTREAAELFDHHFGNVLIKAGYTKDHTWVQNVV
jgi:hypothetical protein